MTTNTTKTGAAAGERLEVAPGLALYGDAAPLLAPLVRLRPELGPALVLAPSRDVHARAAFALSATARGDDPVALADALLARGPRDLLGEALGPPGAHPRLHRLLSRCRLPAWPVGAYRALDAALRAGVADALDARGVAGDRACAVIDREAVADLGDLLDAAVDPALRRARPAPPLGRDRAALAALLAVLRPRGAGGPLEALPDGAGGRALARRAERAVGALRSPFAGLALGGGWEVLATVDALWDAGRELSLCCGRRSWDCASYGLLLASGEALFALHREHGVLAQCSVRLGAVAVTEARGKRNRPARAAVERGLREALRAAGLEVLEADLVPGLRALLALGLGEADGGGAALGDAEDADLGDAEDADVGDDPAAAPDGGAEPAAALAA